MTKILTPRGKLFGMDRNSDEDAALQRLLQDVQKEEIQQARHQLFGQWEQERLTNLDRRNERMRILRLEIDDLSVMKEREIQRFKDRRPLTRSNLSSHEDIEKFYTRRIRQLEARKKLLEQGEWGQATLGRWNELFLEEKNLKAERKRERELGRAKGWGCGDEYYP